jgi:putative transposase
MNRRTARELDPNAWPEFDASTLQDRQRAIYLARRRAVELYVANTALTTIEAETGIKRGALYRHFDHCVAPHVDGRVFGWRALVPYARVASYQRISRIQIQPDGSGAAGAMDDLLQRHPALADWITQQIRLKRIAVQQTSTSSGLRVRLRGLKHVHSDFLRQCRTAGLTAADYPFNAQRMAIRSLAMVVRVRALQSFGRAARLGGASRLKGLPHESSAPPAQQVLDVVEFDGHRLDVRLKVVVRDPLGFEHQFEIERLWLLVIMDVYSRAVLGYHVSLGREYSRYDVIRTIEAALQPHRPRQFTLPGVGYGALGGFPSGKLSELGYATWRWFKLDNAKANLADDVRHALAEFIGCFVDAGPAHSPDDRPYIERFFGSIATGLSSRLPGYTGTGAKDLRRALADPKGNLRLYVSLDELEELLEAAIATYNASPHDGLNGRTPLEAVEYSVRGCGAMLDWLPEAKRRTLCLMQTPRRVTVRGYLHQGQRPHINFHGVRYTNAVLAGTAAFLGQQLHIYYNSQDLRTVRAFAADGAEIGVLKAQGAWGEVAHDLKLRQEILRMRGRKRLDSAISQEFLYEFVQSKLVKAKRTRRAGSELTQTLRTLASPPTQVSMPTPPQAPEPEAPLITAPRAKPQRVEPEHLKVGNGFVGAI